MIMWIRISGYDHPEINSTKKLAFHNMADWIDFVRKESDKLYERLANSPNTDSATIYIEFFSTLQDLQANQLNGSMVEKPYDRLADFRFAMLGLDLGLPSVFEHF